MKKKTKALIPSITKVVRIGTSKTHQKFETPNQEYWNGVSERFIKVLKKKRKKVF